MQCRIRSELGPHVDTGNGFVRKRYTEDCFLPSGDLHHDNAKQLPINEQYLNGQQLNSPITTRTCRAEEPTRGFRRPIGAILLDRYFIFTFGRDG